MELSHTDVLSVIAEVAAAFVGFSLAIGLLQPNQPGAKLRRHAMQSVAELAMVACGGELVVLVVKTFGWSSDLSWRVGSASTAIFWGGTFYWAIIRYGQSGYTVFTDKNIRFAALLSVLGIGLFSANAVFPTALAEPLHITGLFFALIDAGYLFLLSTFLIEADESA